MNERSVEDHEGKYTCVTNNGASVVDYTIVNTEIFYHIVHFDVLNEDFSDHFPMTFTLQCDKCLEPDNMYYDHIETIEGQKFVWDMSKIEDFTERLDDEVTDTMLDEFSRLLQTDLNDSVLHLNKVFYRAAKGMKAPRSRGRQVTKQPEWWDTDCQRAKQLKNHSLNQMRVVANTGNIQSYIENKKKNILDLCAVKRSSVIKKRPESRWLQAVMT